MSIRIFDSPEQLFASVGQEIAVSDWFTVDQKHINLFADATEDHQWIHVDPERAKTGPFGTAIAHGFLTMSLIPYFFERSFKANGVRMIINYGLNRVRFPSPVPVNSRVRAHLILASVTPEKDGSQQLTWDVTIEREGDAKPACIAQSLMRFYL